MTGERMCAGSAPGRAAAAGASFEALTPTSYLERASAVFADRTAVVDEGRRWTYAAFAGRCRQQAGLLASLGVQPGDRVAVLAANSHLMLEAHYGVPYAGAVLVTLNVRLSVSELARIVTHSGASVLLCTPDLKRLAEAVVADAGHEVVIVCESYEDALGAAKPLVVQVEDERSLLALNYTSGTTGRPKGVMYHHRGAYLQALAMVSHFSLTSDTVYLWTLPMFHCNGWTFTWAVTAAGGTHVCLPRADPHRVWSAFDAENITHLCAAPTVVASLVNDEHATPLPDRHIVVAVGGSPPAPALLHRSARLGLHVIHLYGLTETFGPAVICDWRSEWDDLSPDEQAVRRSRQGVNNVISQSVRVVDRDGGDVPPDGATVGEVAFRGNNVMLGYFRDPDATAAAVPDGWFRTGDLAVMHPDGYLEIRDRSKDVIISGGENISSVEVEAALMSHPAVLEAAVVAAPDDKWGERPVAWVTLKPGHRTTESQLRQHVRDQLAAFKVPDQVTFGELPKTASGKIRKFELRDRSWNGKPGIGVVGGP
jgi:fatty-acyl-CoA synthase